jgi:hypothetical protein
LDIDWQACQDDPQASKSYTRIDNLVRIKEKKKQSMVNHKMTKIDNLQDMIDQCLNIKRN